MWTRKPAHQEIQGGRASLTPVEQCSAVQCSVVLSIEEICMLSWARYSTAGMTGGMISPPPLLLLLCTGCCCCHYPIIPVTTLRCASYVIWLWQPCQTEAYAYDVTSFSVHCFVLLAASHCLLSYVLVSSVLVRYTIFYSDIVLLAGVLILLYIL